ncbi:uncharacterized protein MELLADRAFT_58081 [Melampsora larici-populina 98AG31]|uniref:Uncharacterized protein n=1 Tax=Melampsora larici-populina (strain 98AG31 / pathotype 3-4-7) TaxID=747676 RepID=F4SA36_MELLP|nr:uncharacterized protein MELLADRAFT_58081 [Melampsora larici-populina 98AG31]EGF98508.1 hypothetical protein MELLADRAFT_58081 [Melampsora larici-populina 98AG31]
MMDEYKLMLKSNLTQDDQDEDEPIDMDLGPIRAVSRRHARIYSDWAHGRWTPWWVVKMVVW